MEIQIPSPNWVQGLVKRIASSRPGAWLLSHTLHHLDRGVVSLTHGRTSLTGVFTGIPVITLTARGAKTGKSRDVPLIGVPIDDGIILVASNWGHAHHPAWYRNLTKEHTATVSYHGESRTYFVHETEGELRSRCWAKAVEVYPGYEAYKRRAGQRQIPVILLTPEQT